VMPYNGDKGGGIKSRSFGKERIKEAKGKAAKKKKKRGGLHATHWSFKREKHSSLATAYWRMDRGSKVRRSGLFITIGGEKG